ncbi:MAG: signal peptidase I [Cocleimonas sp.]
MIKKRNPIWAGILSVASMGLGHMYAGDLKKGIMIVCFLLILILMAGVFGFLSTAYGIAIFVITLLCVLIYSIVSSIRLARKNKEYTLKSYNKWYWYIVFLVSVSIIFNALLAYRGEILGYHTYSIPTQSMVPTLKINDYITVNTRYSKFAVGDVIVFSLPIDKKIPYVKRVVAVGGDTLSIKDGIIIRNGKVESVIQVSKDRRKDNYSITMGQTKIPESEFFVLGDWRDKSADSRMWGTVPRELIIGKVTYIWLSTNLKRIGMAVK